MFKRIEKRAIDTQQKTKDDMTIENNENTNKNQEKKEISNKESENVELELKHFKDDDEKQIYNISLDEEKEITKIELGKNIVARILMISDEKYIDFCKFYKGYPTKKNIRIKYNIFLKLIDIIKNN